MTKTKILRFGKKAEDILEIKKNFITENQKLFKWQKKLYFLYSKQPKRKKCKNCGKKLSGIFFNKIGIKYILCNICDHLNGEYEDTIKLAKYFYQDDSEKKYSDFYISKKNVKKDYFHRVKKIYLPKVNFLLKSLKKNKNNFTFIDVGCGAGYFLTAIKKKKIKNFFGYDPSKTMIAFGNKINKFNNLNYLPMQNLNLYLKNLKSNKPIILSMIGTFEHIYNNREILKIIKKNKNIKYFYISVPCFSLSSFIETVFDKYFQRLLGPQHTHAYTSNSLIYMAKEFKFNVISEWWFGTDIVDLYRSFYLNILSKNKKNKATSLFNKMFLPMLNDLQITIDKQKKSSEVHMLFKCN